MEDSMTAKKNSIVKKFLQSLTFPRGGGRGSKSSEMGCSNNSLPKSKSWHSSTAASKMMISRTNKQKSTTKTPHGCFCVYVGEEKQKFVIKTECANHPLFKMLLEDAELEYGFNSDSPILIPCDVDLFCKILAEIDSTKKDDDDYGCGSCSPFNNPNRRLGRNSEMAKQGYGSYGVLTPSRSLKLNHF
ncbi:OLC1v1013703C1 [Oldenlandia corymbosa var. corymbosa]|uniref:OLC1v1013703C1 n=1 Tax=Oldenlandia corymbosa var. corymbosa TaxID=529605 RepID=A0AAV1E259_OLDCO|nr:OLC1v1013703C1 [Oldenlandia corymbosa var. corymbosa]